MEKKVTPRVEDKDTNRALKALDSVVSQLSVSPMSNGAIVRDIKVSTDGALRVTHGLGRKANGAIVLSVDRGMYALSMRSSDSKSAVFGVAPQWELLERKDIKSISSNFDFAAVNGDLDYEFMLDGFWVTGSGSAGDLYWRINGLDTGLTGEGTALEGSTSAASSGMVMAYASTTGVEDHLINARLLTRSGQFRLGVSTDVATNTTTAAATDMVTLGCKWEDSATNILTLGVESQFANYLAIGSHFTLYRRPRLTGRTLTIWIF